MSLAFKHLVAAFKVAWNKWQIERLDRIIEKCTKARAKAKAKALKAQAKRDALLK
jgi:hypothetical protein